MAASHPPTLTGTNFEEDQWHTGYQTSTTQEWLFELPQCNLVLLQDIVSGANNEGTHQIVLVDITGV